MPSKRVLIIIIILLVLILLGVVVIFLLYTNQKDPSGKKKVNEASKTSDQNKTAQETNNCSLLTSSESETVSTWLVYKNPTQDYTFKHPSTWEVTDQGNYSVILTDNAALFSFQFGVLEDDLKSGFAQISEKSVTVACISTTETKSTGLPPGGENFRRVLTQFSKSGTKYSAFLSYRFVDESTTSNLEEIYELILKTIDFD